MIFYEDPTYESTFWPTNMKRKEKSWTRQTRGLPLNALRFPYLANIDKVGKAFRDLVRHDCLHCFSC